jgi:hypothetical protein
MGQLCHPKLAISGAEKRWSGKFFDNLISFQVVQNHYYTNKFSAE